MKSELQAAFDVWQPHCGVDFTERPADTGPGVSPGDPGDVVITISFGDTRDSTVAHLFDGPGGALANTKGLCIYFDEAEYWLTAKPRAAVPPALPPSGLPFYCLDACTAHLTFRL